MSILKIRSILVHLIGFTMKRAIIKLVFLLLSSVSYAQVSIADNIAEYQWQSEVKIDYFTIGAFNKIGLGKVQVPIDSLKNDCSIWTFSDGELLIQNYNANSGLEKGGEKCKYLIKDGDLIIIHSSQDSGWWRYKIGTVSSGSYIKLTKQNTSVLGKKHIEQSTPFENILISIKTDSAALFRDAFSKQIIGEDTAIDKWQERLEEAKGKLGSRFGDFELTDFTYEFDANQSRLAVYWKGEKVINMEVVKEKSGWKLNEK